MAASRTPWIDVHAHPGRCFLAGLGASPVVTAADIESAWAGRQLAVLVACEGGDFGREVVAECNRLGMIIDCAHATFATAAAVRETSGHPAMVSHSHLEHAGRHHPGCSAPPTRWPSPKRAG